MIDRNGDENYQPHFVPIDGGLPELAFGERFAGQQLVCMRCDAERNVAIFSVDPRTDPLQNTFLANLASLETTDLGSSIYGNTYEGASEDYSQVVLGDGYTEGDEAIFLWERGKGERRLLFGVPIEQRATGQVVPLNSIASVQFTLGGGLLFLTSLFDDRYGLGYFPLSDPASVRPVEIVGVVHTGAGELDHFEHLTGDRYLIRYNIDGCSWAYEGMFDEARLHMTLDRVICGQGTLAQGALSNGVLQSIRYEKASGAYALSFSTATSPAQIFVVEKASAGGSVSDRPQPRGRSPGCPTHARAAPGHRTGPAFPRRGCVVQQLRRRARFGAAVSARGRPGLRGAAAGRLLHPRRSAQPGAARLHLVLHAADPVLHA